MAAHDYYPGMDSRVMLWLENFNAKLPNYTATFGLAGETLALVQSYFETVKQKLAEVEAAKSTVKSVVASKVQTMEEAETGIRNLVATLKLHKNFTTAIGEDLNVNAQAPQDHATLIANAKPEFQATVLATLVRLDWVKGAYEGVNVESKRGSETAFSFFDKDNRSPCDDTRKNLVEGVPEVRVYRMLYMLDGVSVGNVSDEVRVTVLL